MKEVIIDGVRYIPEKKLEADRISFYYMRDNHTFCKLSGCSIPEILMQAEEERKSSTYGMLCPVIVLQGDKELRRVGEGAHCNGKSFVGLPQWIKAVSDDSDIMRLILAKDTP